MPADDDLPLRQNPGLPPVDDLQRSHSGPTLLFRFLGGVLQWEATSLSTSRRSLAIKRLKSHRFASCFIYNDIYVVRSRLQNQLISWTIVCSIY